MADKTKEPGKTEKVEVVTEADLLKSITDLETKAEGETKTEAKDPAVKTVELAKSTATTVKEKGSEALKKALDVSETLNEIVGLIGNHVDQTLEAMAKSIQGGAERDLAIVKVLGDLKKSIDANTEALKAFGEQPNGGAKTKTTEQTTEVLTKAVKTPTGEQKVDPVKLRRQVTDGLQKLAKSCAQGSPEAQEYITAAIQYESTGKISDRMLLEAQKAMAPATK